MPRLRGLLAGWLLAVGLGLVPLGDLALWLRRDVLDTDRFGTLSVKLIQQPEIRGALADRVTDELVTTKPALAAGRIALARATSGVIATTAFRTIFEHAVSRMHAQLRRGDERLTLDLDPMLPLVQHAVGAVDARAGALVPTTGLPPIEIATKHDAPALWDGIQIALDASWILPLVALAFLAAALAVAHRHARMAILVGIAIAILAGVILVALAVVRRGIAESAGSQVDVSAFDAGWHSLTSTLVSQTIVLGLAGFVLVAAGTIWRLMGRGTSTSGGR
jgi:hypothetical protein